ncbi:MAG: hypothetical protein KDB22_13545 [Planctomycetales bacterium]|nr:hypothetical protein [Planctomycetales bacterium]
MPLIRTFVAADDQPAIAMAMVCPASTARLSQLEDKELSARYTVPSKRELVDSSVVTITELQNEYAPLT